MDQLPLPDSLISWSDCGYPPPPPGWRIQDEPNLLRSVPSNPPGEVCYSLWWIPEGQWWAACHLEKSCKYGWSPPTGWCGKTIVNEDIQSIKLNHCHQILSLLPPPGPQKRSNCRNWGDDGNFLQISLHPILDKTTYHLVNKERLSMMKKVNVAWIVVLR